MYVPETIGELSDRFAWMASAAPRFEQIYNPDGDPGAAFASARQGLANVARKIGDTAFNYLNRRLDENWERLTTGEVKQLKLSLGEMSYILQSRRFRSAEALSALSEHTEVRPG